MVTKCQRSKIYPYSRKKSPEPMRMTDPKVNKDAPRAESTAKYQSHPETIRAQVSKRHQGKSIRTAMKSCSRTVCWRTLIDRLYTEQYQIALAMSRTEVNHCGSQTDSKGFLEQPEEEPKGFFQCKCSIFRGLRD